MSRSLSTRAFRHLRILHYRATAEKAQTYDAKANTDDNFAGRDFADIERPPLSGLDLDALLMTFLVSARVEVYLLPVHSAFADTSIYFLRRCLYFVKQLAY